MTPERKTSAMPGFAAMCLILTGFAGIAHSFLFESGVGLIAATLSFGVIVVVSFR